MALKCCITGFDGAVFEWYSVKVHFNHFLVCMEAYNSKAVVGSLLFSANNLLLVLGDNPYLAKVLPNGIPRDIYYHFASMELDNVQF